MDADLRNGGSAPPLYGGPTAHQHKTQTGVHILQQHATQYRGPHGWLQWET
jgi:hypothetical protein